MDSPRPVSLWFDHEAASTALEAVDALVFSSTLTWAAEAYAADQALSAWEGAAATRFEADLRSRESELEWVLDGLRRLAGSLSSAIGLAHQETARVDAAQQFWDQAAATEAAISAVGGR